MKRFMTPELKVFLFGYCPTHYIDEEKQAIKEKFNLELSYDVIRNMNARNGFHLVGKRLHPKKLLTDEQVKYLREFSVEKTTKETTELMNEKFGLNLNIEQVKRQRTVYHIKSGFDGCFKKGQKAWNKGIHIDCSHGKGQFKKGHIPWQIKEIGYERDSKDGYLERKVRDIGCKKNFQLLHRYIWEQANGKIPDGMCVIFLDGNRKNCKLENLALVTKKEHARLQHLKELKTNNPEIKKDALEIVRLMSKIDEVKGK